MTITGCDTDSPKEQPDRERKAASVQVFKLHMAKDLWSRTSRQSGGLGVGEPRSLAEDPNGTTATIELTGPQMVDYLKLLDYNAHGGAFATDRSLAATVYDTLAPMVDQIQTPPAPGAPVPEVTINAAIASTTSEAPK
ncbi:hypothetical protein ACLMAL_26525 [Nocardia sp. CWNU-33]